MAIQKPTQEMIELLKRTGSADPNVSIAALRALAQALQVPLRQGILDGSILDGIFVPEPLDPGATATYPLDFYQQHNDGQYVAFTIPAEGAIPLRSVVANEVTVQTYDVGNSINWPLKYSRNARWNIVARAMEVMEAGFVKKMNTDGFNTIISAGAGRTDYLGGAPLVFDSAAAAGQFTKRLISLMKTSMMRLAGGNTASVNQGVLTDLFISPEALEDIREWDINDVDDVTRREIFVAREGQGPLAQIYGVNLHVLTELGVGQEFQNFYSVTLGDTMGTSDEEIVIGLDLSKNDSFVMPIDEELTIAEDATLHRRRLAGFYGWESHGFGVLDNRRVIIGSF